MKTTKRRHAVPAVLIPYRIDHLSVHATYATALREARGDEWANMTRPAKRATVRRVVTRHNANRNEYMTVMWHRPYPGNWNAHPPRRPRR